MLSKNQYNWGLRGEWADSVLLTQTVAMAYWMIWFVWPGQQKLDLNEMTFGQSLVNQTTWLGSVDGLA